MQPEALEVVDQVVTAGDAGKKSIHPAIMLIAWAKGMYGRHFVAPD